MDDKARATYRGSGTDDDPYIVEFQPNDGLNPKELPLWRKCCYTFFVLMSVFAVTMTSAAYSASAKEIKTELRANNEEFAAGITLYVLGFAVGPALWAPLSEIFGRWILYTTTLGATTAFVGATAGSTNIASVLVFRFLSGTFSSSCLTNGGATISDLFPMSRAGVPLAFFSAAPSLGPVIGPMIGGFITITIGWRWVQGVCCIFIGVVWLVGSFVLAETYGPVILRKEAQRLSKETGMRHVSILDHSSNQSGIKQIFRTSIVRPWVLLVREPIVMIIAIYLAIIYATIYMFLPGFSVVYDEVRGWNPGVGGLAFTGIIVGMILGLAYQILDDIYRLQRLPKPTPENRLPPAAVGAIALPIGLFGFAWTNAPSIHWSASIILSSFFGFGGVPVFVCLINYLIESYTIYTASVLAGAAMLRAFVGAAFPLFTTQMFHGLGIHWAASIPGFLTILCLPFPFVMHRYGARVRSKCEYARQAAEMGARMNGRKDSDDATLADEDEKSGEDKV